MRRGFQKMPQSSLHGDDCILWRLSSSFNRGSSITSTRKRDPGIRYSSKGGLLRKKPGDDQPALKKKGQTLLRRYEPHCPSRTCTGGHKNKLYRIRGSPSWLTRKVWAKKKEGESLCRCAHCGFVWFQENSKKLGLDAIPVGYYDDFEHPWEFVSLKHRYRIREQNTSRYWGNMERKAIRPPKWGGVD
jgi:hypothetical protein